jgi:hypothetical protein
MWLTQYARLRAPGASFRLKPEATR